MSNLIESQQAGKISGDLLIQIEKIESSQVDETDKTDTEEEGETASTETDEESIEKMSVWSGLYWNIEHTSAGFFSE